MMPSLFREVEDLEVESLEHMYELVSRDVNRIDQNRYENPEIFGLPLAIDPTTGSRSSIAHYINSVIEAGHPLTLSLNSLATKVLFETCDGKPKAKGVEYMVGEALYSADSRYNTSNTGETRAVRAKKEVIVSGGTFNTPQILKLSGVGPREELEKMGIPVVVDLPAVVSLSTEQRITHSFGKFGLRFQIGKLHARQLRVARHYPGSRTMDRPYRRWLHLNVQCVRSLFPRVGSQPHRPLQHRPRNLLHALAQ
jgi:choline dehydrogenase-like flavoprotein